MTLSRYECREVGVTKRGQATTVDVDDYSKGQLDRDLLDNIKRRNGVSPKVSIIQPQLDLRPLPHRGGEANP